LASPVHRRNEVDETDFTRPEVRCGFYPNFGHLLGRFEKLLVRRKKAEMTIFTTADEGTFESFINDNSHLGSDQQRAAVIMRTVNDVAHSLPQYKNAALRGSMEKRTDVSRYSDMDIVVECREKITQKLRTKFIQELRKRLITEGVIVRGYERKEIAVAFDCGTISFDLLFSIPGDWCSSDKAKRMKEKDEGNPFYNKPIVQRVVRALKLLIRQVQSRFHDSLLRTDLTKEQLPTCSGYRLENFVLKINKNLPNSIGSFQLLEKCLSSGKPKKIEADPWRKEAKKVLSVIADHQGIWTHEDLVEFFHL
jgi:predicted nucleotidyltransferase